MHRLSAAVRGLPYLGLLLIVGAAYWPGLYQPARADQLVYLYTTRDKADLFSLTLGSYSWNREIGGDIHFFRPVLVFVLGLERWAFGPTNFFAWQLASLLLHATVVLLLFRWLRGRQPGAGPLAFVGAAFFGVQYASMELVAWHHLSGYLLFSALLVAVFGTLDRYAQEPTAPRQAALVLLLLVAAFTLELGNVLALLVAGYMACVSLGRSPLCGAGLQPASAWQVANLPHRAAPAFHPLTILAAGAVPVLYTAANLADQYYRYGRFLAGPAHEGCLSLPAGLAGMLSAVGLWLGAGFLPARIDLGVGSRMSVAAVHPILSGNLLPQAALAVIALLAYLTAAARSARQSNRLSLGLVALLFAAAYTAVLVFLRAGPRGLEAALAGNSYYAYIFNLALLIFLATLLDRGADLAFARLPRAVLGATLAVLALVSAGRVYEQGRAEARWGKPIRSLVEEIRRLREADGGTDDFTFAVAADHPGAVELPYVGRDGSDGRPLTVAQVFFPRLYTRVRPRYLLCKPYRGFELLRFGGRIWGLPPGPWPRDLAHLVPGADPNCIAGRSRAEVERAIDRRRSRPGYARRHGSE